MIPALPSQTAEVVCWMRAAEHLRPESGRIVDDPYALQFLSRPYRLALRPLMRAPALVDPVLPFAPGIAAYVLARHRYIDEAVIAALGELDQLVLLGAGYDSRIHRLPLGSVRGFEVDFPSTSARKARLARLLKLPGEVVRVPVDFATQSLDERLRDGPFTAGQRTFWVWEGVSMYLPRAAVEGTLRTIRALSGPGSRLAMDFLAPADDPGLRGAVLRYSPALLGLVGEPVRFTVSLPDARGLLAEAGWAVADEAHATELTRRHVPDARRVWPQVFVVTATADRQNRVTSDQRPAL